MVIAIILFDVFGVRVFGWRFNWLWRSRLRVRAADDFIKVAIGRFFKVCNAAPLGPVPRHKIVARVGGLFSGQRSRVVVRTGRSLNWQRHKIMVGAACPLVLGLRSVAARLLAAGLIAGGLIAASLALGWRQIIIALPSVARSLVDVGRHLYELCGIKVWSMLLQVALCREDETSGDECYGDKEAEGDEEEGWQAGKDQKQQMYVKRH